MIFPSESATYIALAAILGLMVGSFLNVVIHRLPKMMERSWLAECAELRGEPPSHADKLTLATPRSRCPQCGHPITALENIPLISFIVLRGRCRGCGVGISPRYPLVEALSGLLCGYATWRFGATWAGLGAFVFIWCMIVLAFIDLDTQLLPDSITLPLLWAGLLFNLIGGDKHAYVEISSAVVGAAAGYLSLWSVYWGFKLVTGKEGMGYGDFKLLAAIGAWLGWKMLPLTILASSMVGATVGIALIVFARHGRNIPIPFGPYLAAAALIALFWGKSLTRQHLGLL